MAKVRIITFGFQSYVGLLLVFSRIQKKVAIQSGQTLHARQLSGLRV